MWEITRSTHQSVIGVSVDFLSPIEFIDIIKSSSVCTLRTTSHLTVDVNNIASCFHLCTIGEVYPVPVCKCRNRSDDTTL